MQECLMHVENDRSEGSPELLPLLVDDLTTV
jgi:hypothetical protein